MKLLVSLTNPIQVEGAEMTVNHHRHLPFLEQARRSNQGEILVHRRLKAILIIALPAIASPIRSRSQREHNTIGLALTIVRNAVYRTSLRSAISDTVDSFHRNEVFHLILLVASMPQEFGSVTMLLPEILSHLVQCVDPVTLFMDSCDGDLGLLLQEEQMGKRSNLTRHSRFGSLVSLKRSDGRVSVVSGQAALLDHMSALRKLDESKITSMRQVKPTTPDIWVLSHDPKEWRKQ